MNSALLSSKKMDYCTPQDFFNTLNEEFHFTLDAAATSRSAKCPNYYTPESDGLNSPWTLAEGGGAVFCNPPYGREIGRWVEKAHAEAENGTTIVLLLPARTDTSYFHEHIYGHAEVRFLRRRLHFTDEDGNKYPPAPFPSMLVIYNGKGTKFMSITTERAIEILDPEHREHYKSIDPVNEACRMGMAALKKQIPTAPTLSGDGYADGVLVYDTWECPDCGERYEVDYEKHKYCPNCGQAIDWSENHG